ncbi:MAG TPA: Ig-like domain-containing protein, partial [Archangium sp.]
MRLPTFAIRALAVLLLLAGCPKPPVELNSLSVTPDEASLARGESVQFVATAWFSDGQVKDVTAETLWSVDDAFVGAASADTQGLVQALGVGQSVVRARYGGKTITRPLIVAGSKLEAIQLDPPHPVLPVGLGVELAVTAIRTDGSKADVTAEVIWTVSSPTLAQVEGATLYGRAPGTLTLTASVQGHTVTVPVDVTNASIESLDVQPAALVLPVNVSRALGAT